MHTQRRTIQGIVYLITNGQFYKIGRTVNLNLRLANLQSAHPTTLTVVHSWETSESLKLEHVLHDKFKHQRVSGEWFDLTKSDIQSLLLIQDYHNEMEPMKPIKPSRVTESLPEPETPQYQRILRTIQTAPGWIKREVEIEVWDCVCEQCSHEWRTLTGVLPDRCPRRKCRSKLWNRPGVPMKVGRPKRPNSP